MSTILGGFLLDMLFGDPQGFPHPVRWIGKLIEKLDKTLNQSQSPSIKLGLGACMAILVVAVVFGITYFTIAMAFQIHLWLGQAVSILLAYTVLATKSLRVESEKVLRELEQDNLLGAQRELSFLVSRDTAGLEEDELVRGTLETIAENISDGVVAPLFYLVLGGVPLAMAYKAINTMDSMVGYKNDQYLYFGRFAARLDDVVNYVPARISALMIGMAAALIKQDWRNSFRIALRDGRNHNSPNSGYPEAAAAGALSIQLGGENVYFGKITLKPRIGEKKQSLTKHQISRMILLLYTTAWVSLIVFLSLRWIF